MVAVELGAHAEDRDQDLTAEDGEHQRARRVWSVPDRQAGHQGDTEQGEQELCLSYQGSRLRSPEQGDHRCREVIALGEIDVDPAQRLDPVGDGHDGPEG